MVTAFVLYAYTVITTVRRAPALMPLLVIGTLLMMSIALGFRSMKRSPDALVGRVAVVVSVMGFALIQTIYLR